jgi:hypothetical protein
MIALQARNPQLPNAAAQTAKFVNMMNMTKQQEAAERQAAQAQQAMDIEAAKEARAAQTQTAAMRKSDQDFQIEDMKRLRNIGLTVLKSGNEEAYQDLLGMITQTDPQFGATIRKVAPTLAENPNALRYVIDQADDYLAKNTSQRTSTGEFDAQGNLVLMDLGGDEPPRIRSGVATEDPYIPPAKTTAAPPPAAAPQTPTGSVRTGKFGEALVVPDSARPLTADQQDHIRRMQEDLGMTNTPASFNRGSTGTSTAGQMTPDMVPAILDSAVNTGVMAQIDLDQMLALAPPQARQGIMDVIRSNKIALQADAPSLAASGMGQQQPPMAPNPVQRPQAQFADMRGPALQSQTAGLRGAPPMEPTLAQYKVGEQIKGKNPSISPTPGIYNVSPGQVAAVSQAQRPSKQELYDAEAAKIKAVRDAGPAPSTPKEKRARQTEVAKAYSQTQSLIDKTYNPKEGAIALARKIKSLSPDQKEAITGFSGYVPSFRESSREADTLINNLKGVVTALGKDAAAASGAIGPMAVQEWKIVSDQIANLDLEGMTPRALDAQMDRIIQQVSNATRLAERVYDVQFGDDLKDYPSFKLRGIPSAKPKTPVTKAPPGVSAAEWKAMTPAERKLWQ